MGPPAVPKPSRSDDVLHADHQLLIYNEVRAQFDSIAPKRPVKPSRSEPDADHGFTPTEDHHGHLPELENLRFLQHHSQTVFPQNTPASAQEEFVETEYYKALDSIDKQHHTTGSGFIKVGVNSKYDLELNGCPLGGGKHRELASKSNPAMNDWTPKFDDDYQYQGEFVSVKPNRSESC